MIIRRLFILNPNATETMTRDMLVMARKAVPESVSLTGRTNTGGPPAIQGAADAEACLPGLFAMADHAVADGADAIVVGCFDDTGLATLRARLPCPVIGLGEAGMLNACLLGTRFAVVTTTEGSVPVIEGNIRAMGLWERCTGVHAARVPVLQLDSRIEEVRACIARIATSTDAASVVLGCAGMSPLAGDLAAGSPCRLVDPVRAAAALAVSLGESVIAGRQDIVAAN